MVKELDAATYVGGDRLVVVADAGPRVDLAAGGAGERRRRGQLTGDPDAADERIDVGLIGDCLLYTSPSPRDRTRSRMPSSA